MYAYISGLFAPCLTYKVLWSRISSSENEFPLQSEGNSKAKKTWTLEKKIDEHSVMLLDLAKLSDRVSENRWRILGPILGSDRTTVT